MGRSPENSLENRSKNRPPMKVSDATILLLGDADALDDGHWLGRWGGRLSTAIPVPTGDDADRDPLPEMIEGAPGPVVAIAYGGGVERLVRHAEATGGALRGAFLVAPRPGGEAEARTDPLPFPSILVASRDDPACPYDTAEGMGARWGSHVIDAGEAGRIDGASGRGPWPEGLMVFAKFLSHLPVEA